MAKQKQTQSNECLSHPRWMRMRMQWLQQCSTQRRDRWAVAALADSRQTASPPQCCKAGSGSSHLAAHPSLRHPLAAHHHTCIMVVHRSMRLAACGVADLRRGRRAAARAERRCRAARSVCRSLAAATTTTWRESGRCGPGRVESCAAVGAREAATRGPAGRP